jgi:hypothetical protein
MSFFDSIIQNLFPSEKNEKQIGLPLVIEPIKRTEKENNSFFRWLNEHQFEDLLKKISKSYQLKKLGEESDIQVHILKLSSAQGIAITYHSSIEVNHFLHLFDLWKDRILREGYILNIAERQFFNEKDHVKKVEKYYLKTPISRNIIENQKIEQKFGNILLELIFINDKPLYLKLLATTYSDRMYNLPYPFENLLNVIFS